MFYNVDHSFWYIAAYWTAATTIFGASLHTAIQLLRIEIGFAQEIVVVVVSALAALVPAIGPYLAFVVGMYLLYRMADTSLGAVVGAVFITRAIAVIIALGLLRVMVALGLLPE